MNDFVKWLGPSLRKAYRKSLMRPANWRMITMLSSLDEQEEKNAEEQRAAEIAAGRKAMDGERK